MALVSPQGRLGPEEPEAGEGITHFRSRHLWPYLTEGEQEEWRSLPGSRKKGEQDEEEEQVLLLLLEQDKNQDDFFLLTDPV